MGGGVWTPRLQHHCAYSEEQLVGRKHAQPSAVHGSRESHRSRLTRRGRHSSPTSSLHSSPTPCCLAHLCPCLPSPTCRAYPCPLSFLFSCHLGPVSVLFFVSHFFLFLVCGAGAVRRGPRRPPPRRGGAYRHACTYTRNQYFRPPGASASRCKGVGMRRAVPGGFSGGDALQGRVQEVRPPQVPRGPACPIPPSPLSALVCFFILNLF